MNGEGEARDRTAREYGWVLVIASIAATLLAFAHPQLSGHQLAIVMRELVAKQMVTAWVHGLLIAAYLMLIAGLYGFARTLGFRRPENVMGLVFYATGTLAMINAAVINGFALAVFAGRHTTVAPQDIFAITAAFNIAGSIAVVWAGIGAVALSAAILAWSSSLVRRNGPPRLCGLFGLGVAAATIVLLITGTLVLDVHGFLLLVVSQSAWTIWAGALMIGGTLSAAERL